MDGELHVVQERCARRFAICSNGLEFEQQGLGITRHGVFYLGCDMAQAGNHGKATARRALHSVANDYFLTTIALQSNNRKGAPMSSPEKSSLQKLVSTAAELLAEISEADTRHLVVKVK